MGLSIRSEVVLGFLVSRSDFVEKVEEADEVWACKVKHIRKAEDKSPYCSQDGTLYTKQVQERPSFALEELYNLKGKPLDESGFSNPERAWEQIGWDGPLLWCGLNVKIICTTTGYCVGTRLSYYGGWDSSISETSVEVGEVVRAMKALEELRIRLKLPHETQLHHLTYVS